MASAWSRKRRSKPTTFNKCSFIILLLDLFEEIQTLSAGEQLLRSLCRERAALFIQEEAARWKQRGKCKALREGDANTRYFHARSSMRLRNNKIQRLEVGGASLFAHDAKVYAVTVHYSGIKGSKDNTSWAFDLSTFYNGR